MDEQRRVAEFVATHDLAAAPEYRILDLASEVGELAKEACEATDYGYAGEVDVARDELGDALFALLALAGSLDHDAGAALEESLAKYERRLAETGDAGSGE
jgi:NTP pyrophosphatase (non-canonical NTP hydrolase)